MEKLENAKGMQQSGKKGRLFSISKYAMLIEMVGIFILFEILTKGIFLSSVNLSNLLLQGCTFSIMGIGMGWILISGGIDLSAGAVVGFLANFAATMEVKFDMGAYGAIGLTLLIGIVIGFFNGYMISYRKIPAFITTLGSQLIFKGLTLLVGEGKARGPVSDVFSIYGRGFLPKPIGVAFVVVALLVFIIITLRKRKARRKYGLEVRSLRIDLVIIIGVCAVTAGVMVILMGYKGIAYAIVLLTVLSAISTYVSENTIFGRSIYALGGNREAAHLAGINVKLVEMLIYVSMGLINAIASIVFLGRVGQATATVGTNFEFNAITGCIVGGVSTLGGTGSMLGAVLGTMLMASLENGMSLMNLDVIWQYIVKGMVLLIAVNIDVASKKNED